MNLVALSASVFLFTLVLNSSGAFDWDLSDLKDLSNTENLPNADKRYARLSFYRPSSLPRRYGWRPRYSSRRMMPWDYLPPGFCLRKRCRSHYDCCRSHNLCDPNAKVCYDCWYGHPCSKNADCCQRYPYCNLAQKTCSD
ncbi:uncharacterized protein LOC121383349 isoform X2 [Gigantopelta aegis]|uniref:uncharacterized protein LOC121383349 isoform X2 n=1 Tax=Gigantopelta aegis TaxID=1735272 RepID=UPI001B88DC78|nr:uncharacterized protein LOC121383349 isoform X2 [Gigantopelta aegis]